MKIDSKKMSLALLIFYLAALTFIIVFKMQFSLEELGHYRSINLIPFGDEKNPRFFLQLGLNAVMFMPFGFMLPVLWEKCRTWSSTLLAGFFTSLAIEIIQLFSFRATDVDDLIMNTLGAYLGYVISWAFFHKKWAREPAPGTFKVSDSLSMTVSILIPLLTIVLVRTPISDRIYRLPLFD